MMSGCYHNSTRGRVSVMTCDTVEVSGIAACSSERNYSINYNFLVDADSLVLLKQQPEELLNMLHTDSVVVYKDDCLVVADIRILPNDITDSVWVYVARDQSTFGWIHESVLLAHVVPDDPISLFVSTFSDVHLLIFLIFISLMSVAYIMRMILRHKARLVHFNDIDSFYPTLLTLLVSSAAALYSSIQMFVPDVWQGFYFHPTMNPFVQPAILAVFLVSVWAILIVGLAVMDVVNRNLPIGEAVMYLLGLAGVCATDYILFSITTLYYIGYPLLVAYFIFAIRQYLRNSCCVYVCGNCGEKLHDKGTCPACGTINE